MKLVWLLERSMWGIISIRWYAYFSDLAKISWSREFQRDLKEDHRNDITDFIKNDDYKFFPEVILGYTLKYDYDKKNAISWLDPMKILLNWWTFTSNVDWTRFSSKSYKSLEGIKTDIQTKIVIIDTKNNKDIFSRIDWNHRLSAYDHSDWIMSDFNTPFCLVLFVNDDDWDKTQKVIFNNINSKVRPLTSEENLKNIIDTGSWFSDAELRKQWPDYLLTRKLKEVLNLNVCSNLQHFFVNKERTVLKELSKLLLHDNELQELDENHIVETINKINTKLEDKKDLFQSSSYSILIAFIYFSLKWKFTFNNFYNWLINNHVYSLEEVNHYDLIGIFEKVMNAKEKEIFLSMPFSPKTNETYIAIKQVVEEINSEEMLSIKLREIRLDKFEEWYSYAINEKIYELIERSWYLIADLSQWNKNVYNELWFLMWLNKAFNKNNDNFLLIADNRSGKADNDTGFNIKNLKCLRFKDILSLKKDIKVSIKKYYGLK